MVSGAQEHAGPGVQGSNLEQAKGLVHGQALRNPGWELRLHDVAERILGKQVLGDEPGKEARELGVVGAERGGRPVPLGSAPQEEALEDRARHVSRGANLGRKAHKKSEDMTMGLGCFRALAGHRQNKMHVGFVRLAQFHTCRV